MTCKDCVHYEACKDMYDGYSFDFDDCDYTLDCIDTGLFKNKANFVEVVRCKDCKYYSLSHLACRYPHHNGIIGMDGYCSYGERKTNE